MTRSGTQDEDGPEDEQDVRTLKWTTTYRP